MWHMHDLGWAWWLVTSVGMIAVSALLIYGVVVLVSASRPTGPAEPPRDTPHVLLKRRLASGEISLDEYEQRRQIVVDTAPPPPREPAAR
jgi:putative membrane protein